MRQILFFLNLLFMSTSTCCFTTGCAGNEMSENELAINNAYQKTINDVNRLNLKYPLYLVGTGGSIDHHTGKEKKMNITFRLYHPLSKEAGRWLIVEIAKLFLNNINSSAELKPFLPDGHFTYQNLQVKVGLQTPDRDFLYYPDICYVALREGEISYAAKDPQYIGTYGPYKEVIYESFEEALKIVEEQDRPEELKKKSPK